MGTHVTRRQLLAAGAAGAIGAATAACTVGPAVPDPDDGPWQVTPNARLSDIDHVVILMQENRSFDHYFGTRPGVRGFADPTVRRRSDGRPIW